MIPSSLGALLLYSSSQSTAVIRKLHIDHCLPIHGRESPRLALRRYHRSRSFLAAANLVLHHRGALFPIRYRPQFTDCLRAQSPPSSATCLQFRPWQMGLELRANLIDNDYR